MKRFIIFITISLLFTACEKLEPYDKIYYHNVGAEGYVYYEDNPVPNVWIGVKNSFEYKGKWTTKTPIDENFTTDANGYFCIKFIKKSKHEDINSYVIHFNYNNTLFYKVTSISPKDIRESKQNLQLGKLYLSNSF